MAKAIFDLHEWEENDRIALIAGTASENVVGFIVEDDAKADRYCRKLAKYPVRIIDRKPGPVKDTILVRVGPKES